MDSNFPPRNLPRDPVMLPGNLLMTHGTSPLRRVKKAIIEEFLPRYGYCAEVLYVGDAARKYRVCDEGGLPELGFLELAQHVIILADQAIGGRIGSSVG